MTKAAKRAPKAVRLAPRRGVRDRDIHLADPCQLTGRQLVLRRQQSHQALLGAFGGDNARGRAHLAAAIEQLATAARREYDESHWPPVGQEGGPQ